MCTAGIAVLYCASFHRPLLINVYDQKVIGQAANLVTTAMANHSDHKIGKFRALPLPSGRKGFKTCSVMYFIYA